MRKTVAIALVCSLLIAPVSVITPSFAENKASLDYSKFSRMSPKDVKAFEEFWLPFKAAVLAGKKNEVIKFVKFPFKDALYETYHPDNTLTSATPEEFLKRYDEIFDRDTIEAIRNDSLIGYGPTKPLAPDEYFPFEKVFAEGTFILEVKNPLREKNLFFDRVGNKYFLTQIPYYE